MSRSRRAGVTFPIGRIERHLRNGRYARRVSSTAAVSMAAILDYLVAEILELAGDAATEQRQRRIRPRHLQLAIRNDVELDKLVPRKTTIPQGGTLARIHSALLPKKSKDIIEKDEEQY